MPSAKSPKAHRVAILVLPGVIAFDVSLACEVFGRARSAGGQPCYDVRVCGPRKRMDAGHFRLELAHGLPALAWAQTIIVPGVEQPLAPLGAPVLLALATASRRGARLASICSGAFALAQAGLLDGLRATTHWMAAPLLARHFPAVEVDARVLFVDQGRLLSSAGAAAGLDLCLHMVRQDFGTAVAARVARLSVVPLQREGGQAQFIQAMDLPADHSLQPLVDWTLARLHLPLSTADLARQARSSLRTLTRRFHAQFGMAPGQWLTQARVRRAQELLETSQLGVEHIVARVGLGSAAHFRTQFARTVGVSPSEYRRSFGMGRTPS
jgi:transcriptional regulator GlxA family with amidase domain